MTRFKRSENNYGAVVKMVFLWKNDPARVQAITGTLFIDLLVAFVTAHSIEGTYSLVGAESK